MTSRPAPHRLLTLIACAALIAGGGATIALAADDEPAAPPAKSLDRAVADAIAAPAPVGVSARVVLTNDLPPMMAGKSSEMPSVFRGAEGHVWMAEDRVRADLKGRDGERVQLVADGRRVWFYDSSSNRVVRTTLPDEAPSLGTGAVAAGPEAVRRLVAFVQEHAKVSTPEPGVYADRPSYTVEVQPKGAEGFGRGELTWDAAKAIPLRAAVYLGGSDKPSFEVRAEDVRFGAVDAATFDVEPPASADVTTVPQHR